MSKPPRPLDPEQAKATDPRAHAALSASAGTGKTHVLTSRVFRLLLGGAAPESILGLTFTKAGAANMAERIGDKLAKWVRMERYELAGELQALGEPGGPEQQALARTLFAKVLDAPGGIRVQTIHAFAQSLLAAFPAEAGISPGFKLMEGRAQQEIEYQTLSSLLVDAEQSGNRALIADVESLSRRLGEEGARKYLSKCARYADAFGGMEPSRFESELRRAFGVPDGEIEAILAEKCSEPGLDCALLRELAQANRAWGASSGLKHADLIDEFLALDADGRVGLAASLLAVFRTGSGTVRKASSKLIAQRADYESEAERLADALSQILDIGASVKAAADMAAGLRAGRAFALAYQRVKRAQGLADFDDLIAWTRALLKRPGISDWVRFKLDQRIDHILVDEAQDTNADQWGIIDALTDDFFSGATEIEERHRTLLIVGDFKQAIFRFQGTDPAEFEKARRRYREAAEALFVAEDESSTASPLALPFRDLGMNRSFRSAQGVLDVVDATIEAVGWEAMGLPAAPLPHVAARQELPGVVELWPPFAAPDDDEDDGSAGEETWLDLRERQYAEAIAMEIRDLLDSGTVLESTGRPVTAGDILILVRRRQSLSALIVARLFAAGVPVGGVDRLQLHSPLAVQDLVAAMKFAVQPLDDLNLACLLVSPLMGWDQDRLMVAAADRGDRSLWRHLRDTPSFADDVAVLQGLLAMADFVTPAQFLETILSGPMQGRAKLYARLSEAARDPIDELMNAALSFERDETPSLDHFLSWFARGDVEVARDSDQQGDEVRVMTVHGAKGLEAPVVIIADAHIDPERMGMHDDPIVTELNGIEVPVSRSGTKALPARLTERLVADKNADLREHLRLLYVAMTRAIDRLVIAGMAPKRGSLKPASWHVRAAAGLEALGASEAPNAVRYGNAILYERAGEGKAARQSNKSTGSDPTAVTVPGWALRPAPVESRPPRPLAPSAIAKDDVAAPPPGPGLTAAAERGTWIHSLLERLVDVAPDDREDVALRWLERSAPLADVGVRREITEQVLAILADPNFAPLFGPGSLGEAPLAATLPDGRVIAGTVDRLLVEDDAVSVIDFKTGRVPSGEAAIPAAHRAQMKAYAEALAVIFPGRTVRSSLLYTAGPALFELGA